MGQDADEIRRQIEGTREDMGDRRSADAARQEPQAAEPDADPEVERHDVPSVQGDVHEGEDHARREHRRPGAAQAVQLIEQDPADHQLLGRRHQGRDRGPRRFRRGRPERS